MMQDGRGSVYWMQKIKAAFSMVTTEWVILWKEAGEGFGSNSWSYIEMKGLIRVGSCSQMSVLFVSLLLLPPFLPSIVLSLFVASFFLTFPPCFTHFSLPPLSAFSQLWLVFVLIFIHLFTMCVELLINPMIHPSWFSDQKCWKSVNQECVWRKERSSRKRRTHTCYVSIITKTSSSKFTTVN